MAKQGRDARLRFGINNSDTITSIGILLRVLDNSSCNITSTRPIYSLAISGHRAQVYAK